MRHDIRQLTHLLSQENFKPTTFAEIGSRDGHDTSYICGFWHLDPSNCIIIEAHPVCYNNIIKQYPQFRTLNIAASNKTEVVKFNAGVFGVEENVGVSSLLDRTLSPFISEQVEVDGWKMSEVMEHINIDKIDFMKIDVEGFGLQVLQGFDDKILNTKYIQIEVETKQVWEGQSYYDDIVTYMSEKGFVVLDEIDLDGIQKDIILKNIKL